VRLAAGRARSTRLGRHLLCRRIRPATTIQLPGRCRQICWLRAACPSVRLEVGVFEHQITSTPLLCRARMRHTAYPCRARRGGIPLCPASLPIRCAATLARQRRPARRCMPTSVWAGLAPRRPREQLRKVFLVQPRNAGGAMAARVGTAGDQHVAAILDALDLAFHYAKFRGIALVVG